MQSEMCANLLYFSVVLVTELVLRREMKVLNHLVAELPLGGAEKLEALRALEETLSRAPFARDVIGLDQT